MALGASGGNTVAMIVRSSVAMVAIGGVIGLVAAVTAGAVDGRNPLWRGPVRRAVVRAGGITLLIAGVVASLLPALRTTRVDPVVALREQ